VSTELRDWLAEIKNNHQSGTADYVDGIMADGLGVS
jgi:hypothetical protein